VSKNPYESKLKNGGRRSMFFVVFIDLEGCDPFPTYPKNGIKTNVVHLKNFGLVSWIDFKSLKIFLEEERG